MAISYTSEAKLPLLDTGSSNWGAVANAIYTQIDQGYELNFTAEEELLQYDAVFISDENKASKADANNAAKRPAMGIALTAAIATAEVQVLMFGWLDYDDTALGGALGASNNDIIYLGTTAGQLSTTPDTDYPEVMGIAKSDTTANITKIFFSPVLQLHQLVDKDDAPTFERVTIIPIRGSDNYEYGLLVDSDGFFVTGASKKTYMAYIGGDRVDGEDVTGDSNDALLRMNHSNYAENDSNFIMRGINGSLANRDAGTMNMLEGINYSVRQRGDAGIISTLRGAYISIQMDVGSGAVSTAVKGLKVDMRCEANCPADSAGIEVRNYTDGIYDIPTAAYSVKNNGTSGCLGFEYGIDFYDTNAGTVNTAEIRGSNGETIDNLTDGKWNFGSKITAGAWGSPIDVTVTRKYGFELHYSGNDYDVFGIRSRANLITTTAPTRTATGAELQAANSDGISVNVLCGAKCSSSGKSTSSSATISYMRAVDLITEWGAKDTITNLYNTHIKCITRNAAGEGSFGTGYGIYLENIAVGGTGQALNAGIYFKDTSVVGNAFTYGIDFSGATFATAEIRGSNGETISNITDGIWKFTSAQIEIGKTAYFTSEVDNGNSGANDTIDWTAGNKQKSTLTDDCTYTFNPAPSGPCSLTFRLIQDGVAGHDATWPAAVKWLGTEPTWSDGGANKSIVVSFYFDGTNYWAQGTSWEA